MPTYLYQCEHGCQEERYLRLSQHQQRQDCLAHWLPMQQIITAPLLVKASADVCYDSPIDGKPITSMQARQEDLKRSGCRAYDPAQKQDYDRRIIESEAALDRDIEATVEESVSKMDGEGRRRLASELLDQGVTTEAVRKTYEAR